jgi:hypothetical protein
VAFLAILQLIINHLLIRQMEDKHQVEDQEQPQQVLRMPATS